ncbi:hypothetical protein [Sphingomonas sp.]|uniref:hypothetical protein n=1 Tax=Sphingomonas sp. TaxID=28214 RepID=UPI0035A98A9C
MALTPFAVLPLALGTVATGNAAAATPATHLGEFNYRGMVWKSSGNSNLWVRGDFGTAKAIDFVSMMGANALAGTQIRVRLGDSQAEVDGSVEGYDSGTVNFIAPAVTRQDGIYHSHLELPSTQTRRWWRIDISGHTGDFSASMLVMGLKVRPSRYYETNWTISNRDLGSLQFGRNGVPGITTGAKLRALNYKLAWLTEAEAETMIAPLDDLTGRTTPMYLCFDPETTVYRQRRTFFGWNEEQPSLGKIGFNRFERTYQILSLF